MKRLLALKEYFIILTLLIPTLLHSQKINDEERNGAFVCASPPVINLSSASGTACGTSPFTLNGNTFGGSATNVTITDNGAGVITSGVIAVSPFGFSYIPAASDAGNVITITLTTNNPSGAPCTAAVATFQLTVAPNPVLIVTNPAAVCTPGTVNLTAPAVTVGSSPGGLTYWTNAAATNALSNPNAVATSGTYYIKLTSASGCVSIQPVTVTINVAPTASPFLFYDLANSTATNAAFDFNNAGQSSFWISYSINGGPPVQFQYFSPSHYDVPITPGQCVVFTLIWTGLCMAPLPPVSNIKTPTFAAVASPICSGSAVPALPTTSQNGITGTWSPSTISSTTSGNYTFTPNGSVCASPVTISVAVTPSVTPNFAPIPAFCSGSTAPTLSNTSPNGITGTWSPGTVSNTVTQSHTFTPTAGQCASTQVLTTTVTPLTTPNFAAIPPICSGSAAPVLANTSPNGVSGSWSPAIVSNTTGGSYTFTPTAGVCATAQTLNVTVTPRITPTFTQIAPVCKNAALVLPSNSTNSPAISGTWSPAPSTATVGNTVYTFTPNAGQCTSATLTTMTIQVLNNQTPSFPAVAPFCAGTTAPGFPIESSGITGTWSPSTINNSSSGTYTFTPSAGQCASVKTINVTVLPTQTVVLPVIPLIYCSGSAVPALPMPTNGITGTWFPAAISNTASGTYTFTPTPGQCATSKSLSITINQPTPIIYPDTLQICQGNTATALPTTINGISGSWSPSVINTAAQGVTVYTFTATPGQCVATPTHDYTVTVLPTIQPGFQPIAPFCEGTVAPDLPVLSTTSPNLVTGTWSPSTINNMASGSYTFTPDLTQCSQPQTLFVTVIPKSLPVFNPIAPFCNGSTAPLLQAVSNNGFTGTWSPAVIDNTLSGSYLFTPDAPQCATTAIINVTVNQPIDPTFPDIAICSGTAAPALGNTSPNGISGTWSPAVIDNLVSGSYVFTPNVNQCANVQTIAVTINEATLTSVNSVVSNAFSENNVITVLAEAAGNYLYQLDFGPLQVSNVFDHVGTGTHTVTVVDANGCAPSITESDVLVIGYPHYFTPNGDSYNDTWNIVGLKNPATIFIFDRYGKLLKQISPQGEGWDGTYNGQPLPSTDYWFKVNYSELGASKEFRAHFSLKR